MRRESAVHLSSLSRGFAVRVLLIGEPPLSVFGPINPVDVGIVQSLFGTFEEPRAVCP